MGITITDFGGFAIEDAHWGKRMGYFSQLFLSVARSRLDRAAAVILLPEAHAAVA